MRAACIRWFLAAIFLASLSARADEPREPDWLAVSLGDGNILHPWQPRILGFEYRSHVDLFGQIHPKLLLARSTKAANYAQLGLFFNWDALSPLRVTFSTGPGVYQRNHEARDLRFWLQFHSALELSLKLSARERVAVSFGHLSNAGLRQPNPGAEVLSVSYSIALFGERTAHR